ncbi:MAG: alpha/beta fold hydrolase [Ktedonobacteraceae bacterium]
MVQNTSEVASTPQRRMAHTIHYDISYSVQGEEYGRDGAIVLLHDFPAGAFVWSDILPQLVGLNRAVYAIDMLGYGQSDHPWPADTSVWGQADCLSYMFKELQLTDMILVGHGFGGGVAQVLATRLCRDRTAALVLIDTICYLHSYAPNWPVTDMQKRQDPDAPKEVSVVDMLDNLQTTLPAGSANPQRFSTYLTDYIGPWNSEIGKELLYQQIRNLIPNYINSVASDLKVLGKPTLIIWGEKDQQMPLQYAQRLHRDIPESHLVIVPDAGHMILFDAPGNVASALTDFIGAL